MSTKYLLFGGSGFIGIHLEKYIVDNSLGKPVILDIVRPKFKDSNFEEVDVRKQIKTKCTPETDDIIFNLAAVHRTPGHPSAKYFETNILGAENICNYARTHNINTIIFTSSIATYGTYEAQKSENTMPMPDIPYGISKLTAEYIHKMWQQEDVTNRKLIIIRPGVVFGQFENGNFTRLINSISKRTFFYPGRKDTIKACIYVKDLVQAMIQISKIEKNGGSTYNATYEPAPTIEKICEVISEKGVLTKSKIRLPAFILIMISKVLFALTKKEGIHPDRVKKLLISNNINGEKLNNKVALNYGLENGLLDWMNDTNFEENKTIY